METLLTVMVIAVAVALAAAAAAAAAVAYAENFFSLNMCFFVGHALRSPYFECHRCHSSEDVLHARGQAGPRRTSSADSQDDHSGSTRASIVFLMKLVTGCMTRYFCSRNARGCAPCFHVAAETKQIATVEVRDASRLS